MGIRGGDSVLLGKSLTVWSRPYCQTGIWHKNPVLPESLSPNPQISKTHIPPDIRQPAMPSPLISLYQGLPTPDLSNSSTTNILSLPSYPTVLSVCLEASFSFSVLDTPLFKFLISVYTQILTHLCILHINLPPTPSLHVCRNNYWQVHFCFYSKGIYEHSSCPFSLSWMLAPASWLNLSPLLDLPSEINMPQLLFLANCKKPWTQAAVIKNLLRWQRETRDVWDKESI